MSLHDRITGLAAKRKFEFTYEQEGYLAACQDAARLATEAEELMAEMAEAISVHLESRFNNEMEIVLKKYNTYKERNNEQ